MTAAEWAVIYAGLAAMPVAMQIALAGGAPLGRFANGGRFPGRLPPLWRGLAIVQGGLLVAMALVALGRADLIAWRPAPALFAGALVLTALTCLANWITPSRGERFLWGPVTSGMLISLIGLWCATGDGA